MAVLDDIRNGKGLKPIYVGYECVTCENKNCTGHGLPTTEKVCDGYKHTPTNADRLRAKSDEELSKIIGENIDCAICKRAWRCRKTAKIANTDGLCPASIINGELDCYGVWLDWLKAEVEE